MKKIDLHIHTNASDGIFQSKEIVDIAIKKGMKAIAITDHDSVSGIDEALKYSQNKNIKIIPGIEISCDNEGLEICDIHIVGLFIDHKNKKLVEILNGKKPTIEIAVKTIKDIGGISILAHPLIYITNMKKIIKKFIMTGGNGIEVFYYYSEFCGLREEVKQILENKMKKAIESKELLFSGGSDFHGDLKEIEIGMRGIDEEDLEKFYELKNKLTYA